MAPRTGTASTEAATHTNGSATDEQVSTNSRPGRIYVVVPMTAEMKQALVAKAEEKDSPVGIVARDMLADLMNMTVPVVTSSRPHKYANKDEQKAAQRKALKERNALVKALLSKFKEGALPDEIAAAVSAEADKARAEAEAQVTPAEPQPQPELVTA